MNKRKITKKNSLELLKNPEDFKVFLTNSTLEQIKKVIYWGITEGINIDNKIKTLIKEKKIKINDEILELFYEKYENKKEHQLYQKYKALLNFFLETGSEILDKADNEKFEDIFEKKENYLKLLKIMENSLYTAEQKTKRNSNLNMEKLNTMTEIIKKLILYKFPKNNKTGVLNYLDLHFKNITIKYPSLGNSFMNVKHLHSDMFFSDNIKDLPYNKNDNVTKENIENNLKYYIDNIDKLPLQFKKSLLKELYQTKELKNTIKQLFKNEIEYLKNNIKKEINNDKFIPEKEFFEKYFLEKKDIKIIKKEHKNDFNLNDIESKFFGEEILKNISEQYLKGLIDVNNLNKLNPEYQKNILNIAYEQINKLEDFYKYFLDSTEQKI